MEELMIRNYGEYKLMGGSVHERRREREGGRATAKMMEIKRDKYLTLRKKKLIKRLLDLFSSLFRSLDSGDIGSS